MKRQGKGSSWTHEQVVAALSGAKAKLEKLHGRLREPVAVIGVGCRFPQASGPDSFWKLLEEGRCAITDTPSDRWDASLKAAGDKEPGKVTANRGGFLDQVDQFDATFFGIARREAETIDPQQRLLLEVAWETTEHAGLDTERLRGSRTGVFVGMCSNDYLHRLTTRERSRIDAYLGTGNAHGAAAGRVSYFMNWQGPSVAVDTACSSSLTALHMAVRSLRYDDCNMALVAGVNLILTPELSVNLSQAGMLSPTGLCQTFDASADGFVRGEGCGAVLLKRLSTAVADGDRILCVVRGSASNQDGRSNGLTAPNGVSQQAVVRAALADANVSPEQIDYLEAHGTGTQLGDPIEMNALGAVFGPGRDRASPLRVGSVKTNIGHLEGAAGIAGVIKVALALGRENIPAHLHFHSPSPHIDWSLPIVVPTATTRWERGDRARLAGVSSFGFGGTNAHVVLEEAPPIESASGGPRFGQGAKHLFTVSAKTSAALRQLKTRYSEAATDGGSLPDLCHTANVGRTHFDHRYSVVAETVEELAEKLKGLEAIDRAPGTFAGSTNGHFAVHWLFGDACECRANAGRTLYESHPSFREELDRCGEALSHYWPRSLSDILWPNEHATSGPEVLPALFCLQFASAQLWRSWGISPKVIVGHGFGEYAAACAAGVLSLEDALRMVTRRAELLRTAENPAEMRIGMAAEAEQTAYAPLRCPYASTANGHGTPGDVASAEYWVERLPAPGDPARTLRRVVQSSRVSLCLEMGVGGSLAEEARRGVTLLPGLTAPESEWSTVVENLAQLYAAGARIHWHKFNGGSGRTISLPTYPFQRKRYWFTDKTDPKDKPGVSDGGESAHPLLGVPLDLGGREVIFETDLKHVPYLRDHRVGASTVFPAAGFLELAIAAGSRVGEERLDLMDLTIERPMSWDEKESCRVQVIVAPAANGYSCRIRRHVGGSWQTSAECRLVPAEDLAEFPEPALAPIPDPSAVGCEADVEEHYRRCRQVGVDYGPAFRGIRRLVAGDGEAWAEIALPELIHGCEYGFHPALLDSCFQVSAAALGGQLTSAWLPVRVARYSLLRSPAAGTSLHAHVRIDDASKDDETKSVDLRIENGEGSLVAEVGGLLFKPTCREGGESTRRKAASKRAFVADLLRKSASDAHAALEEYLYARLGEVLEMEVEELPDNPALSSLGLDSLMAFELRDLLERNLGVTVPLEVFLQDISLPEFTTMLFEKLESANDSADDSLIVPDLSASLPSHEGWIEGSL